MLTPEQRAHDIAVSILPHVIKESNWNYFNADENDNLSLNIDVSQEYISLYENLLVELKDY